MIPTDPTVPAPGRGRGRWIVISLWLGTLIGSVAMLAAVVTLGPELDAGSLPIGLAMFAVIASLFTSMGALIESRRPGNRVGWLMAAIGPLMLVTFSGFLVGALGNLGAGDPGGVAALAAWAGGMGIAPFVFAVGPLMAAIFPDGRLPSRRWRIPVLLVAATLALADLLAAFVPGPVQTGMPDNPFGIEALRSATFLVDASSFVLVVGFLAGVLLAVAAVVTRFRRSRGQEREQMKWFVAAIGAIGITTPLSTFDGSSTASIFDLALIASIGLVPVAVGIAVTRYRLYDIDTIINRAIVYGLLTAILAGGSAAVIGLLQRTFMGMIGGSDAAILLTTLLVVAVFDPVKKRLQAVVDRRFKERPDPMAIVTALADRIAVSPWAVDRDRALRALLQELHGPLRVAVGRANLLVGGDEISVTDGTLPEGPLATLVAVAGGDRLELVLPGGPDGVPDDELAALRPAVERLLVQLG